MEIAAAGTELCTLQGVKVIQDPVDPGSGFPFGRVHLLADADIDADGSPHAYNPRSAMGLDNLFNAGHEGNWFGIATNRNGVPFIQLQSDPAPGFYVSTTAYKWMQYPANDPRRYVDSETVPFIVVEDFIRRRAKGVVLGCKARITNTTNGKSVDAVVADLGPLYKIGEISMAAAKAIGIPWSARTGGEERNVVQYELWPGVPAVVNGTTYNLVSAVPLEAAA